MRGSVQACLSSCNEVSRCSYNKLFILDVSENTQKGYTRRYTDGGVSLDIRTTFFCELNCDQPCRTIVPTLRTG